MWRGAHGEHREHIPTRVKPFELIRHRRISATPRNRPRRARRHPDIEALPVKVRARLARLLETVENVGPEALCETHVKHLDGKL